MARYFFHVFNGDWRPDTTGAEFPDEDRARAYGRELVADLLAANALPEALLGVHGLIVDNEFGDRIMSLRGEERHP